MAFTILLVDDSPTILNLLRLTLRQGGFVVATASDGVEALEVLDVTRVDMIITDVNMPRMDGLTLISRVRQMEYAKDLPIIVLSTQQGRRDHKMGRDAGADLYLDKPVTPTELIEVVNRLMSMHSTSSDGDA